MSILLRPPKPRRAKGRLDRGGLGDKEKGGIGERGNWRKGELVSGIVPINPNSKTRFIASATGSPSGTIPYLTALGN
jgi:hypothetical protein